MSIPVRSWMPRMTSRVLGVVDAGGVEARVPRGLGRAQAAEPASSSAVAAPSRPSSSNSSRSWLDDTWMSIDGLSVGTTSSATRSTGGRPSG